MSYKSSQLNAPEPLLMVRTSLFFIRLKRIDVYLLIETVLVTILSVLAIRFLATSSASKAGWFLGPGILVFAVFVSTAVRKAKFPEIGLRTKQIGPTVLIVCQTCLAVFPVLFICLWLLKSFGLALPLKPKLPSGQSWISWLFYQFMYVAVAEEVFFRGYVQHNILKLTNTDKAEMYCTRNWICIVLSAVFFAAAHVIVQGKIILALTFLPGLILGWLFVRTKSLLAPIIFHGLANTCYCVMAMALA